LGDGSFSLPLQVGDFTNWWARTSIGGRQWAFHDERVEKSKESGLLDILEEIIDK
jgi:hypothetical protein